MNGYFYTDKGDILLRQAPSPKIAIILPAYNEELSIANIIEDFHRESPDAYIYVINNNSSDKTEVVSRETMKSLLCKGAVLFEGRQGKANAIRKAFREIDADIYVMADADGTYRPEDLARMLDPILSGHADIVVGERFSGGAYRMVTDRAFHSFGNRLVCLLINFLFKSKTKDIMSGYRVMTREFVKHCPLLGEGFEIETEMTIHAVDKRFTLQEIPISYHSRPEGNPSKLNTYSDGMRILKLIVVLFKHYRPMLFFGGFGFLLALAGLIVGTPVILEFIETGIILKIPSAILASGLGMLSALSIGIGLVLDSVAWMARNNFELLRQRNSNAKN